MKRNRRTINVIFSRAGSNSQMAKMNLPITWIRAMGITPENRGVEIVFDGKKITIQKKEEENEVKRI